MTEKTLEQCVLFVRGWLSRIEAAARGEQMNADDLPPGFTLPPSVFLDRQQAQAQEASAAVASHINTLHTSAGTALQTLEQQRSELADKVASGQIKVMTANQASRAINTQTEPLKETLNRLANLHSVLLGEKEASLPRMPLYQYPMMWQEFADSLDKLETTVTTPDAAPPKPSSGSGPVAALKNMQRSDKIAIVAALVLSAFVVLIGYQYMYSWGRLHVNIEAADDNVFKVTFTNSYGDTVLLQAPYDGKGLQAGQLRHFGIFVEILKKDGSAESPDRLDSLWTYKDQPTHLYGPVLISPLSAEDVFLHLPSEEMTEDAVAIRITLYRAPHRRYAVKTIPLARASNT